MAKLIKLFPLVTLLISLVSSISVDPLSLRADGLYEYLGLPNPLPRLSWRLNSSTRGDTQRAYQVQASTTPTFIVADLWDTGKITSSTQNAVYAGKTLTSRTRAYWRIRVWDMNDAPSPWGAVSWVEMALLDSSDWSANWIANTGYVRSKNSLPVFTKEFSVSCKVERGRLYLLGLGQHDALLNGKQVTDEVLAPGYSTINETMLYSSYDVTSLLAQGENVLGVELGKGEYDSEPGLGGRYMRYTTDPVQLKLIAQLEWTCADGSTHSIISDTSWLSTLSGPRIESSWYGGEEYDSRLDLGNYTLPSSNRTSWTNATLSTSPGGLLTNPATPPLKIVSTIPAVSVTPVSAAASLPLFSGSGYRFDLGANIAGFYRITMCGSPGQRVVLVPGESFTSDGAISQAQWTTGYPIYDAYTFSTSEPETFTLKFMYHGFQYLMVNMTSEPQASDLVGLVIRTDADAVGSVSTSNTLFNEIHGIISRSIESNFYSVLTDCPHREKWGWLEESHLVFTPVSLAYDLQAFGKNFARTMANAQTSDGLVPSTTPEYLVQLQDGGIYRDDPNWGSTSILQPYNLYLIYGETDALAQNYGMFTRYMSYLESKANGYLLEWGLGDWVTLDGTTPLGVTSTLAYAQCAEAMATIASVLGKTADAQIYSTLHSNILSSFHDTYFNATSNSYASGSQASNAIALDIGVVPANVTAAVLSNLVASVVKTGYHMTVGEIALPSLFRALMAAGRDDVIYQIMSQTAVNSYGFEVESGAVSLWEEWDALTNGGSRNHFMLGYGDSWFWSLAGIAQANTSVAWKEVVYKPIVGVGNLTFASSNYRSTYGLITAEWTLSGNTYNYEISVPVGSTGLVYLNGTRILESQQPLRTGQNGVMSIQQGSGSTVVIGVGSGNYSFVVTM